jgi:predicted alpha/beta hydrolase family esterase
VGNVLRRSARPAIIVAHSFGCLATVHRRIMGASNLSAIKGALDQRNLCHVFFA